MLRSSALLILALVVFSSVCAHIEETADAENNLIREKRQQLSFEIRQSAELPRPSTLFINGRAICLLTGCRAFFENIEPNDTKRYENNQITFENTPIGPISASRLTKFIRGRLQEFFGNAPDMSLGEDTPGFLYYDEFGRAFCTDNDFLEQWRPFPPLTPLITCPTRGARPNDRLILNLDINDCDGWGNTEDDRITLTGSMKRTLTGRQSLEYLASTIITRDRNTIIDIFNGINELTTLNSSGLGTFSSGDMISFDGPGTLFTNEATGQAFYTTDSNIGQQICEKIIEAQFQFSISTSPPSAIMQSTLGQTGGNDIIQLADSSFILCETDDHIAFNNGIISTFDRNGNLLLEIGTPSNPIDLSTFFSNELEQFSGGDSFSRSIPPGGLSLWFNSETNRAFAYPTLDNTFLTHSIESAIEAAGAPLTGTAQFRFQPDGLGGANLIGQEEGEEEIELISLTSGQNIGIGENDIISYSGNTINISRGGSTIATYNNIDLFSANGPSNTLDSFAGEAIQTYRGPGSLSIDSQGRAFFTTDQNLINRANRFIDRLPPGPIPRIEPRIISGTRVVNIETPMGERLIEISSATSQTIPNNQSIYYFNNQAGAANTFNIPQSSQAFFDTTNSRATIFDSQSGRERFTADAMNFFAYLSPGGMIETITQNTTFPSNGFLYTGPNGAFYTINNDINGQIINTFNMIGANRVLSDSTTEFSFYNGQSIQRLTEGARTSLPGEGIIFTSGNQSFYSTDPDFNNLLCQELPKLLPISVMYNRTDFTFSILNHAGDLLYVFSAKNSINFVLGTGDSFTYNGDTVTGLTFRPITGVDELRHYTCFLELQIFLNGENNTFNGPGFFSFNPDTGTAFFTDSEIFTSIISQRENNVFDTFQRPVIVRDTTDTTSKFREVDARFGRAVTVYEGANVNLLCDASNADPCASFEFFVSDDNGMTFVRINETDMTDNLEIVVSEDGLTATLQIMNAVIDMNNISLRYLCRASNIEGRDSAETIVEVRPHVAPEIVNDYFPLTAVNSRFDPRGRILTARSVPTMVEVTIAAERTDQSQLIPNPALVTNLVHIGCKAEGRPKAEIVWRENGVVINSSAPQFDIFEPREGRSVLTVNYTFLLEPGDPIPNVGNPTTYTCTATNGPENNPSVVVGMITITPNEYICTAGSATGDCSVTCGFGVRELGLSCSINGAPPVDVTDALNIPSGLFETQLELCQGTIQPFCDFESFAYNDDEADYGECSVTCDCGVERRNISCFRTINGALTNETVDERFCEELGLKRPDETRVCVRDDCPFWVINGTFGPCSQTCRGGIRVRQVDCYQNFTDLTSPTNFTFDIVDDMLCDNLTRPASEQECNRLIPCPFRWDVSNWEECQADFCQERNITCVNFEPTHPDERWPVDDSFCDGLVRPHSVRSCNSGVCSRGVWRAGPFTECSVECGFGTYNRTVVCTTTDMAGNTVVLEDGFCDRRLMPAETERCIIRNCPGRCDFEPNFCPQMASFLLCKVPEYRNFAEPCCKSCPLQATPIPLLDRGRPSPSTEPPSEEPTPETPMGPMTMATP